MQDSYTDLQAGPKVSHNFKVQVLRGTKDVQEDFMKTEESTASIVYLPRAEIYTQTAPEQEAPAQVIKGHFGKKFDQNNYQ